MYCLKFFLWLPHHNGLWSGMWTEVNPFSQKSLFPYTFITTTKMKLDPLSMIQYNTYPVALTLYWYHRDSSKLGGWWMWVICQYYTTLYMSFRHSSILVPKKNQEPAPSGDWRIALCTHTCVDTHTCMWPLSNTPLLLVRRFLGVSAY